MSRKRFTEEFEVEAVRQSTERGFAVRDVGERFTLIAVNQIKECFNLIVLYLRQLSMKRTTGIYSISTTLGESVRAFVPNTLPPF